MLCSGRTCEPFRVVQREHQTNLAKCCWVVSFVNTRSLNISQFRVTVFANRPREDTNHRIRSFRPQSMRLTYLHCESAAARPPLSIACPSHLAVRPPASDEHQPLPVPVWPDATEHHEHQASAAVSYPHEHQPLPVSPCGRPPPSIMSISGYPSHVASGRQAS